MTHATLVEGVETKEKTTSACQRVGRLVEAALNCLNAFGSQAIQVGFCLADTGGAKKSTDVDFLTQSAVESRAETDGRYRLQQDQLGVPDMAAGGVNCRLPLRP